MSCKAASPLAKIEAAPLKRGAAKGKHEGRLAVLIRPVLIWIATGRAALYWPLPMSEEQNPETAPEATETTPAAADVPPDHLAIDPRSPNFDGEKLQRGVGIRFKGRERRDIEEYCISEGWVRVQAGRAMDRKGRPLTIKLKGEVEAWYEDLGENPPVAKA